MPAIGADSFHAIAHRTALALVAGAVARADPPHALLLVGPSHVGKTTLALDLAAGLSCLAPDAAERPCRACVACRKVASGNHPDLHRLQPEGAGEQIRLGQVQRLIAELALLPMEGRFRIAIVEGAHRLNPDAQNALLKTLEEPPAATCLILAADDEAALLPTVRSRCATLRLGPLPASDVAALLARRGLADPVRASGLARLALGRPGLAIAFAQEPESTIVHARLARSLLDLLHADRAARLAGVPMLMADAAGLEVAAQRGVAAARDPQAEPARGGSTTARRARPSERGGAPTAGDRVDAERADGERTGGERVNSDAPGPGDDRTDPGERPRTARNATPQERRRAAVRLMASWRDVARDLAVAKTADPAQVAQTDLLDDLLAVAPSVDLRELLSFVSRVEALLGAVEAYANPELALDALLLAWPRAARQAA